MKPKNEVAGGIFLPDTAKEKPQEAEVVALGTGKNDDGEAIEFSVKVGDTVLISKYGGTDVKDRRQTSDVLVNESDILGIRQLTKKLYTTHTTITTTKIIWLNNYHSTKQHVTHSCAV